MGSIITVMIFDDFGIPELRTTNHRNLKNSLLTGADDEIRTRDPHLGNLDNCVSEVLQFC
jgi:hypothetical protein